MLKRSFKLALVQMLVEGGEKEKNLDRAEARIREAARHGAAIVVLPEAMDLGWTHPSATSGAEPIPGGATCRRLMKAAAENRVYACAGLTERDGNQVFNSAVLIDPKGELLIRHRKLNELDIGHNLYAQGDRLNVCRTEYGTLGLLICADATTAHYTLLRSLGYMGADIILSPSAWAVPPDHDNRRNPYGDTWRRPYQTVAREFNMWIAGVSNVGKMTAGPWKDWNCIGCSLLVDADGKEVLQGPYGADADTIIYADVNTVPRPARGTDWDKRWAGKPAPDR
ncbi:MAG: carbon-nitrogen hydrolase family protein [Acidobacteriota bacterium]